MIYLDNAATTRVAPEVLEEMMPYLNHEYGNAGSVHSMGRRASDAVEQARCRVANLINAEPEQIIFTSGGSEANNLAILGLRSYLTQIGKRDIIVSAVEHSSVLKAAKALAKDGFGLKYLGVDSNCVVSVENLKNILTEDVGFVSTMHMNNEIGSVNPIKEIANLCSQNGILFHTDCVQSLACVSIDVRDVECDFLSISSHKIHGTKGVGALYVRDKGLLEPIIFGSKSQEFGVRGGTENVPAIVGFGKACDILSHSIEKGLGSAYEYKTHFYKKLISMLHKNGIFNKVIVNGGSLHNQGRILNIRFDGIDGETLLLLLDSGGVCVSAGSACQSHESTPSHVLTAIGLSPDEASSSVRISFSDHNNLVEVERAANLFVDCVMVLTDNNRLI